MATFSEAISQYIWETKYRYQDIDQTIEDTWHRVARAVAQAETTKERKHWQQKFYDLLAGFNFLPGGRILAGAGTSHNVTLLNCFVMCIVEDDLTAIFEALKEGALTLQQGGGIGYDFSVLRPAGQLVKHTGATATGPISFMRVWDSMSATMQACGARRGAMMGVLRCDHPDIEEFITAKSDPAQLRHFNVSVLVTDEFIRAVENNTEWALVFPAAEEVVGKDIIQRRWSGNRKPVSCRVSRYISARKLWEKIIRSAYEYAEPGVIFEDTINRLNPLWYREWISATNPCGEIPLPPYGACDLGSLNLTQVINDPYTKQAQINWQKLTELTECATRFLDNVISVSHYPLKQQKQEALATRRIGLGFTGLADALVMLGIRYGSSQSLELTRRIMQTIHDITWQTSIALAREKESFPVLNKKLYLQGEFVQRLPEELRKKITRYGIRNSHHNAIAPTGTISLLANNVSNGIEPIFGARYERDVRTLDGKIKKFKVTDYAFHIWQKSKKTGLLPPTWVEAHALKPEDHLRIQGAVQPFVDHAISKTINIPADFPFETLQKVYSEAYKLGLKGCTIFRPNPVTGSVLKTHDVDHCCPV